jgi:WD40 repeat protein
LRAPAISSADPLSDKIIDYRKLIPRRFVGRQWVRDAVDGFLRATGPRYFLLLGEPGSGKTSFMADLVERRGYPHHFIGKGSLSGVAASLDWRNPIRFAESLGYQLLRDYGGWIMDWESWGIEVRQEVRNLQGLLIGSAVETFQAGPRPPDQPVLTVDQKIQRFGAAARVVGVYVKEFQIDPEQVVRQLLTVPLDRIARRWPEQPVVLVVDGLDEAEDYSDPRRNILHLLPNGSLPSNIRLLLSSRPGEHLSHDFLQQVQPFWLSEDEQGQQNPGAMEDAKAYFVQLAQEPPVRALLEEQELDAKVLSDEVAKASRGNFLYLYHYAQGLRAGDQTLLDLKALPEGLHGIYGDFLRKIKARVGDVVYWDRTIKPVLGALAVAREPLTRQQIASFSGLGQSSVGTFLSLIRQFWDRFIKPVLGALAVARAPLLRTQIAGFSGLGQSSVGTILSLMLQFLEPVGPDRARRYKFYHPSFGEYVISEENRDYVSGPEAHARVVATYRREAKTWDDVDWREVDGYGLRHLPAHLAGAGQEPPLYGLLECFGWLAAKLGATHVRAVLQDYDYVIDKDAQPRVVHEAIKRSAQVFQQDPAQLAGQLVGRLFSRPEPGIQNLLDGAAQWQGAPWLRPLTRSLIPPRDPLLFTLAGHEGTVRTLAITPDGRWGITAGNSSEDGTVRLWDLGTGTELHTLADQADDPRFNPVALTPDGRWALVAREGDIHVWNVATGEEVSALHGHDGRITALAVAESGRRAISGAADGSLVLWDVAKSEPGSWQRAVLLPAQPKPAGEAGAEESVHEVAITPDGAYAVALSSSTVRHWDLERRQLTAELPWENGSFVWHERPPLALPCTGRHVFYGSPLRIWDVEGQMSRLALSDHDPGYVLAVAPDGKDGMIALVKPDRHTLEVWDIEEGACGATLPSQGSKIAALALTPDGQTAVAAHYDHYLKVWALEFTAPSVAHSVPGKVVEVTPDGRWAVVSENGDVVEIWDFDTGYPLSGSAAREAVEQTIRDCWNKRRVWEEGAYAFIKQHAQSHPAPQPTDKGPLGQPSPASSESSDRRPRFIRGIIRQQELVVAAANDRQAITYVKSTGKTSEAEESGPPPTRSALSLWNLDASDSAPVELRGHSSPIKAVSMTHDGRLATSACVGRTVRVWDLEAGRELRTLRGHRGIVWDVQVTPDGRCAVSASEDRSLRVWDLRSWECVAIYTNDLPVKSCAVSDDGRAVAACDLLGRVHLLRLEAVP